MSLLGNIRNIALSVVEGLEDVEALKTMRASESSNANAAEPHRSHAAVMPLTCPKCGGAIHVPEGQRQCFCTYCGTPLQIDDGTKTLLYRKVDETRIREAEIDKELELARMQLEEKRRPGRIRASIILAIVGGAMMIGGFFLGDVSGDSNSPWYMVAMLGLFPLMGTAYVWIFADGPNERTRRRK